MFWYDVMYNVFEKLKFSCLRNFPTPTAAGQRRQRRSLFSFAALPLINAVTAPRVSECECDN